MDSTSAVVVCREALDSTSAVVSFIVADERAGVPTSPSYCPTVSPAPVMADGLETRFGTDLVVSFTPATALAVSVDNVAVATALAVSVASSTPAAALAVSVDSVACVNALDVSVAIPVTTSTALLSAVTSTTTS